jgi:hypothetical protein
MNLGILKMTSIFSFEKSGNTDPTMQCHIPEDLNPRLHSRENLITCEKFLAEKLIKCTVDLKEKQWKYFQVK